MSDRSRSCHAGSAVLASRDLGGRGASAEPSTTPPGLSPRSGRGPAASADCPRTALLPPHGKAPGRRGERGRRRWRLVAGGSSLAALGEVGEVGSRPPAARFPPDMTHRHGRCGPARPMPGSPAAKPLRSPQACSAALARGRTDPDLAAPARASTVRPRIPSLSGIGGRNHVRATGSSVPGRGYHGGQA